MRFDLGGKLKWPGGQVDASALDITTITKLARRFRRKLRTTQANIRIDSPGWYPYDSLVNFEALKICLTGDRRFLLRLAGNDPILDIGCADGALSFFLESLGCRVDAVDYAATNYNRLAGFRSLQEALHSSVNVHNVDLDSQFSLPGEKYGLAFFLGTLYHLKNPYYVLETLARRTRFCVLSTRVARFTRDKQTSLHAVPVAYLLDELETNHDSTNYWIFSETGLRRLIKRTGWEILDYVAMGNTVNSDPVNPDADERAFCLLKSR